METKPVCTFKDVEDSLHHFSGDDHYSIYKWIEYFEENGTIYGWSDNTKFIYAKRLMTGTARLFLRTKSFRCWTELRTALVEEFSKKVTSADLHNLLRNRKKKKDETFQTYVLSMQEISSLSTIEETDIINYIINGIADTAVNKMILYNANSLAELKSLLVKYEKMKSCQPLLSEPTSFARSSTKDLSKQQTYRSSHIKCFNCNESGHISQRCPKPVRLKGSCFRCGKLGHHSAGCPGVSQSRVMNIQPADFSGESGGFNSNNDEKYVCNINSHNFEYFIRYIFDECHACEISLLTLLDSGSGISLVQKCYLPTILVRELNRDEKQQKYFGINNSQLKIVGTTSCKIIFKDKLIRLKMYVVENFTMKFPVILGRDFLELSELELRSKNGVQLSDLVQGNDCEENTFIKQILNIDNSDDMDENGESLNVNDKVCHEIKNKIFKIVSESKTSNCIAKTNYSNNNFEMKIKLVTDSPFSCTPRRLSYSHKIELQKILDDLLKRNIIRESNSPYASPIVLVQKKNREMRMCVDFRELNRNMVRDNYPLPVIDDLLDRLYGKKYFSILDLKSGFHHVKVADDSVKYTSFVTPLGQFEYLRMPFGLKTAPSVFQRFINHIFKSLLASDNVFAYLDDILIATTTIEEHFEILEQVMNVVKENYLELRFDKCKFLYEEIVYLGYTVNQEGIRPSSDNIRAVSEFPVPKSTRDVQSFLGLCSYFRRFVKNFAVLAKPLYDLIRKDVSFQLGPKELETFEVLKSKLIEAPILAIYNPHRETELHCDASSVGFGAILFQRQADERFHPVFYFSKRATDTESRYHSYELETLSIIYALRRFRIYLTGIKFKIVTDCQALTLTLNKKLLNPRISRWALEMQTFDYIIEHRKSVSMSHVDALSRCVDILVIEDDTLEHALAAAQDRDSSIRELADKLEKGESQLFVLLNGLVYRKEKDGVRFYVPIQMENTIIQTHHESLCHLGPNKCYEYLKKSYWFPNMREKIKKYISNCLKCIYFSVPSGKTEGTLHSIPKGSKPFETLHIDHLGPLSSAQSKKKYILLIIDGFTKFVKLYAVNSTQTYEVIRCLDEYFAAYSRPSRIISDRGTCFISHEFSAYLEKHNIQHIKVATQSPQSNGQVERINRTIIPMLSKECNSYSTKDWYKNLHKIEFALNNTICKSIDTTPSILLFGVNQKGEFCDRIKECLKENVNDECPRNLEKSRTKASENIIKNQNYNKKYFDKKHKLPHKYKAGDLVMLKNVVTTAGINKKLLPKFRGPFKVSKVLDNGRYIVTDVDNMQISRIPYRGTCAPANMKPYINLDT